MATELLTFAETILTVIAPPLPPKPAVITEVVRYIPSWQEGHRVVFGFVNNRETAYRIPLIEKHPLNAAFTDNGIYCELMGWDGKVWYPKKDVTAHVRRYGRVNSAKKGNYVLEYTLDTPSTREVDELGNLTRVYKEGYLGAPLSIWVEAKSWVAGTEYKVSRGNESVVYDTEGGIYYCILPHVATQDNSPNSEEWGRYWSLANGFYPETTGTFVPVRPSDEVYLAAEGDITSAILIDNRNVLRREIEVYEPEWIKSLIPEYFQNSPIFNQTIERFNSIDRELNYRTDWMRLGLEQRMIPCDRYVSTWREPVGELKGEWDRESDFLVVLGYCFKVGQQVTVAGMESQQLTIFETRESELGIWNEQGKSLGNGVYGYKNGDFVSYLGDTYRCTATEGIIVNRDKLSKTKIIYPDSGEVDETGTLYWTLASIVRLAEIVIENGQRSFNFKLTPPEGGWEGPIIFETSPLVDAQGFIFSYDWKLTERRIVIVLKAVPMLIRPWASSLISWVVQNAATRLLTVIYRDATGSELRRDSETVEWRGELPTLPEHAVAGGTIEVILTAVSPHQPSGESESLLIRVRNIWTINIYKRLSTGEEIFFDTIDGIVDGDSVPTNQVPKYPADLGEHECHTFERWNPANWWNNVTQNLTVYAEYRRLRHCVHFEPHVENTINGGEIIDVSTELPVVNGTYDCGTQFTVRAVPYCGFRFLGWSVSAIIDEIGYETNGDTLTFTLRKENSYEDIPCGTSPEHFWVYAEFEPNYEFDQIVEIGDWENHYPEDMNEELQCGPGVVKEYGDNVEGEVEAQIEETGN